MFSLTISSSVCLSVLIYLSAISQCPVSAQAHLHCQNCFYGPKFCDPNTNRCIYGCREGWKGDKCLDQCITKGCKHCEDQPNGIEQCTSCLKSGHYGPLCNLRCSANCKRYDGDDVCDHFGNCIYGCVAPYIGNKCADQDCPFVNCLQCAMMYNNVYCHQCLTGYYWIPTIQKCTECTKNCLYGIPDCDHVTGRCKSGKCKEGWVGMYCNIPCDIQHCTACKEVSGKAICITCEDLYFPNLATNSGTCSPCSETCGDNSCDRQTGQCIQGCKSGYYGNNCELKCNVTNCDECAYDDPQKGQDVLCTKCSNGYYYDSSGGCQLCPTNCKPGTTHTCQLTKGECLNGCKDGWYGPYCEDRCNDNCINNVCNAIGSCQCKLGWFGHRCDRSCPIHCDNCNNYIDGVCGTCEAGWYGLACTTQCSSNCKRNNYNNYVYCNKTTGECREGCNPGWYGDDCTKECSRHCATSNCVRETGECTHGCHVNRYGPLCNMSCPANCKNPISSIDSVCNSTGGNCLYGCAEGYYGSMCALKCSVNCFGSICDLTSGYCREGCNSGYTGNKCDQICTSTCPTTCGNNCLYDRCDAVTNTCTAGCHQGWYGTRCEKICPDKCLKRICYQNTGSCQEGCVEPYYGLKCDAQCSDTCLIRRCEQSTGNCEDCKDGFYGPKCKRSCPAGCHNSTCEKWTGHCHRCGLGRHGDLCTQDCIPGYHGDNCESVCGHCKDGSPCHIYDGECPSGCDIGWTGLTCMQAIHSSSEQTSDPNQVMQIAIGCAVGGLVCCLVIIAAICWFKRRKLAKSRKAEEPSVHFRNAQVVISHTQPTGSSDPSNRPGSNQSSASEHSTSDPLLGDPQSSQIRLLDVIRQGRFYSLVKGEVVKQGATEQCCVKLLKLKELKDENYVYRLTLESEMLAQCGSHKNIISLIKTYQNAEVYCVAVDNCLQTGLLQYLRRLHSVPSENGAMSLDPVHIYKITQFVTDICSAVCYIHDLKIIHRALRAGHVYLSQDHVTKLGDFDWAEWNNTDHAAGNSHRFELPTNYFRWLAPESSVTNKFSYQSDIWSLGMVFWEVFNLARKSPYSGLCPDDHKQAVTDGIRPAKPSLAHFSLYRVMKNCWRYDPADRPLSEHILSQLQMIQASTWTTVQQL